MTTPQIDALRPVPVGEVEEVIELLDGRYRNVSKAGLGHDEEQTRSICLLAREAISRLASKVQELKAENERLIERVKGYRARLEADHHFIGTGSGGTMERVDLPFDQDEPCDGIECRNETIKLLQARIATLTARLDAAMQREG